MVKEFFVLRTCTEIAEREGGEASSRPLQAFREHSAYVLLGEPGAGKSRAFEQEQAACGDDSVLVSARDFVTLSREAWRDKTLFIDGLDEMRAGNAQGGAALDAIRQKLEQLGRPRFRLSCRAADWYGASDQQLLKQVAPNGELAVLQLDPLTLADMQSILENKLGEHEATAFMAKAETLGMQDWLTNPQTLNMLVEAVTERQQWPHGRQETYELACKRMAREHGRVHRNAMRGSQPHTDETLLDAAGWLCAVLLLADLAGFALDEDAAGDGFATLSQLVLPNPDLPVASILKSSLFKPSAIERCTPVHRSVAEYLGARWLAAQISQHGLPLGRVLALMTGTDGGVVTGLRGLYAWLAVFGIAWRDQLIVRDALGLVLYGDVKAFPKEDKRRLLNALYHDANLNRWLNYHYHDAPRFGALATADMEDVFREILNLKQPDRSWQVVMDCMMDAMQYGEMLPGLADDLLRIVRDADYWPPLRESALHAFVRVAGEAGSAWLLSMLEDIRQGAIEDGNDELMGKLLKHLYPRHIPSSRVFDYLHAPKQQNLTGAYRWFWIHEFHERSADHDVPVLLDQWTLRAISSADWMYRHDLNEIKGKLLVRGVMLAGEEIETERLYRWLSIGIDSETSEYIEREQGQAIALWLSRHPEQYKALLLFGIEQCLGAENIQHCLYQVEARLYGAMPPADIAEWCLQQADLASHNELAHAFFDHAVHAYGTQSNITPFDLKTLEFLEGWVRQRPRFQPWLEAYLAWPVEEWRYDHAQRKRDRNIEKEKRKNAWMQFFREHQAAIRGGSAHPKVLGDLATAYFGHAHEAPGETPTERLDNFLDHDAGLVADALSGFRHVLTRNDLPSVADIVASSLKGSRYYLCWPCQAGMALSTQEEIAALDEDILATVIAFQYLYPAGNEAAWEEMLRRTRPDLMAKVLVDCALPYLRAGKEHVHGLYGLAYSAESAGVAKLAVLPLLRGFPVRAKKVQLSDLRYLLIAGLRYLDKLEFLELVSTKLGYKLDDPQRVYWLAAAMVADPATYTQVLSQFVGKSQAKAECLTGFFPDRYDQFSLTDALPENDIAWLIELIGKSYRPYVLNGGGFVSHAMGVADLVQSWIRRLGSMSTQTATDTLATLLLKQSLSAWHDELRIAMRNQRVIKRDSMFQHPPADRVCLTLKNLQPATPADLAALTLEHLQALRDKIRHGATNDYRQYWSLDRSNKQPETPKPENECRDALLSALQERLGQLGVEAVKEGYYAKETRADIRVSFGGFNIPVEIKKENHRDLWTAIRKQLIDQYTQEPNTGGYGIYLVFWFGGKGVPLSAGKKPVTATELEARLSEVLTSEERRRISVIVIDCSVP